MPDRPPNPYAAIKAFYGDVPMGDSTIEVMNDDNLIGYIDIYWHTITVGGNPFEVAWLDHEWIEETYQDMGFGTALVKAAMVVAAREREWGALYTPNLEFFEWLGWFRPPEVRDHLVVTSFAGKPETWPPGEIEVER